MPKNHYSSYARNSAKKIALLYSAPQTENLLKGFPEDIKNKLIKK